MSEMPPLHVPASPVRFVTAAALFDGHDAAINIMRRILQAQGAEVIQLGHNRSVDEIVTAAVQEDAHGVAVSSYQGGHVEFFEYLIDLLRQRGAGQVRVYGGGGGVIVAEEVQRLHRYGVSHLFMPEDGQRLGLARMVNTMIVEGDNRAPVALPADWWNGVLAGDCGGRPHKRMAGDESPPLDAASSTMEQPGTWRIPRQSGATGALYGA